MKYLGNFSAVEPVYTRRMYCWECQVEWDGCWDNFMCPQCGEGTLPGADFNFNVLGNFNNDSSLISK